LKLPIAQKVNRFKSSAVEKYDNTPTKAPEKLLNIKPTINNVAVLLTLLIASKTPNNTVKLPATDANTKLYGEVTYCCIPKGKNPAPKTTKATPKLAPELSPNT